MMVGLAALIASNRFFVIRHRVEITGAAKPRRGEQPGGRE